VVACDRGLVRGSGFRILGCSRIHRPASSPPGRPHRLADSYARSIGPQCGGSAAAPHRWWRQRPERSCRCLRRRGIQSRLKNTCLGRSGERNPSRHRTRQSRGDCGEPIRRYERPRMRSETRTPQWKRPRVLLHHWRCVQPRAGAITGRASSEEPLSERSRPSHRCVVQPALR
jgi:hypothetical protein